MDCSIGSSINDNSELVEDGEDESNEEEDELVEDKRASEMGEILRYVKEMHGMMLDFNRRLENLENQSNVTLFHRTIPGGSPSVRSVERRLRRDKKTVKEDELKIPQIRLNPEQELVAWKLQDESCSARNFASKLTMKLFPHKDLYMKNCRGVLGKEKIPQIYLDTVLVACYMVWGDQFKSNARYEWKLCCEAIDKRLRNSYGETGKRYSAKSKLILE